MTNKEWMSTLTAEQFYDKMIWLIKDYGMRFNNARLAVIAWLDEPHEVEPIQNKTSNALNNDAMRWISVEERLPSQDEYYLVAYKLDVIPQRWHFNVYPFSLDLYNTDKFDFPRKKYKGKSGFYFYDSEYGYCEDSRVTHWMPLPKPPKENKDG